MSDPRLYGVALHDPAVGLRPWIGEAHTSADEALADADADVPPGVTATPVTIIPGVIPARGASTRLYLAGPMTGYPEWNFPAFREAAKALRQAGYEVISPAELDDEAGFDPTAPTASFTREHLLAALRRDALALLECDGIALLPGSAASRGASAEVALGHAADIQAEPVNWWITEAREKVFA